MPLCFTVFVGEVKVIGLDVLCRCSDKDFQCVKLYFRQQLCAEVGVPCWEPDVAVDFAGWRLANANFQLLSGDVFVAVVSFDLSHCILLWLIAARTS